MNNKLTVEQLQEHIDFMLFSMGNSAGRTFTKLKEVDDYIVSLKHQISMLKVDLIMEKEKGKLY